MSTRVIQWLAAGLASLAVGIGLFSSFGASPAAERAGALEVQLAAGLTPGVVRVFKTPTCGCCTAWVEHLREAGFTVETEDRPELSAVKTALGVGPALTSCHTSMVDGYVVEGHVPASVIARLLEERPDVKGIAAPGMPIGSPGMEGPDPEAYDVLSFTAAGDTRVFERVVPDGAPQGR